MTPGLHPNLPEEAYHASPAISATFLKKARQSLAHALIPDKGDDDDRLWYRLTHKALLEPQRVETDYLIIPKIDRRTKGGKAQYAEFVRTAGGKSLVSQEDLDAARFIRDRALSKSCVRDLLAGAMCEVSVFAVDPVTGLLMRARPDGMKAQFLFDVKNCGDAQSHAFHRQSMTMGYPLQFAHYHETLKEHDGQVRPYRVFIAIEDKPPYGILCHTLDDECFDRAIVQRRELLGQIKVAKETGIYPDYSDVIMAGRKPWKNDDEEFYRPEVEREAAL